MAYGQTKEMCVQIEWMIRRQMPRILDIENESFEFPCSEEDFTDCARRDPVMVAKVDDQIVGFLMYQPQKAFSTVLDFAVARSFRRHGIASKMMNILINKLSAKMRCITLEIRETNLPGQLFLRALGFRAVSVLRQFYTDTPEDAYLMQCRYRPSLGDGILPFMGKNRIADISIT